MKTFKRICIQDYSLEAENGDRLELKGGKEYITTAEKDGMVTVFTRFWVPVAVSLFTGERPFTDDPLRRGGHRVMSG